MSLERVIAERPARAAVPLAATDLVDAARALLDAGYRLALVAGHDDGATLRVVYLFVDGPPDTRVELVVRLDADAPRVPSLAALSFPAGRFERELADLFGVEPVGHPQLRALVRHQHWPSDWHPLRRDAGPTPPLAEDGVPFPFAPVEGPGVYEIPVGPVHAGIIEPGHFRFWVVGETILKMKARLWFTHKGVERLFVGRDDDAAIALAERISGDSAVGHSLALVLALEEARGVAVSAEVHAARAALLELERLYNHVGDVGAIANDVGFSLAQARTLVLREELLRLNEAVTGHRLLRGAIGVGAVALRATPSLERVRDVVGRFHEVVALVRANSIVRDRLTGTGVLTPDRAREIGVLGVVARASGQSGDARVAHPFAPFDPALVARREAGDVAARVDVRVDEVDASLATLGVLLGGGGPAGAPGVSSPRGTGTGLVEGWRGTITHRVELAADGSLARVKVVDPSFLTWPALSVALADTIVPDFPVVNKSFNLSYAGNDL